MQQLKTAPTLNEPPALTSPSKPTQFYARLIAEHCTDPIAILDSNSKTEWINAAFEGLTGYLAEECLGRSPGEFLAGPETDIESLKKLSLAQTEKRPVQVDLKQYNKAGEAYWAELMLTPILGEGDTISHFLAVVRDISERKRLEHERELARQAELLRQAERRVLSKTTEWLYAARSLEDLYNVVECCAPKLMPDSSGALFIYSNSRDVLDLAIGWGEKPPPQYIEADECWALRRGRAYHFGDDEIEFPCGHYHGDISSSFCLPLLAHGETIGMLWCHANDPNQDAKTQHARYWDVALMLAEQVSLTIANVRLRQELQDRSIKDPLTGLWNRRYYLDGLRREKARADGSNRGFALISIDVDNFKRFNDHHGHDAGDLVLRRVSSQLLSTASTSGIVCRVGGEELAVICPDFDEETAIKLADTLREAVKRVEIVYQGEVLPCVTISAGVSTYPSDHSSIDELMRNADNALYQAKRAGRDRVVLFETERKDEWILANEP